MMIATEDMRPARFASGEWVVVDGKGNAVVLGWKTRAGAQRWINRHLPKAEPRRKQKAPDSRATEVGP